MFWGRVIGGVAASAAVAGCAALAVGMSRAQPAHQVGTTSPTTAAPSYPHYYAQPLPLSNPPTVPGTSPATTRPATAAAPSRTPTRPSSPSALPRTTAARTPAPVHHVTSRTSSPAPRPRTTAPAPVRGGSLPLSFSTGYATRVITVTAPSYGSTTAWLQAWVKAPGGGWLKYGSGTTAHVGSQGLTWSPSESKSATPVGSFSLTQAFGYYANPGTGLAYFRTTPADWWISTAGSQYNTHQRCSSCGYGPPDEQLYYETPYYNYAVVINTPSGAAAYPHGSAFFLHVTDGNPTAGCVAIAQSRLVPLMQWLTPAAHPRILIGVG